MLVWLDMEDVKECISQGYEQDDEAFEIEHLLDKLFEIPELHIAEGASSAALLPIIENNKVLREALVPFMNGRMDGWDLSPSRHHHSA
jgi:hypothetical protein